MPESLKRLLTGICYILVLLGFFVLRICFHQPLLFDLVVYIFAAIGTFEMCRALQDRIDIVQKVIVMVFSVGFIVAYTVSDSVYKYLQESDPSVVNYSPNLAFVVFIAGIALLMGLLVFRHEKTSLDSAGYSLLAYLYPSAFLLVLSGCNHMPDYSEIAVLFVFVICPFSDCFAYMFGKYLRRFMPAKLAPNISPNKTIIGCVGGLLGGAIGAVCIFFVYNALPFEHYDIHILNILFFIALGVLTAAFTEFGDLVESAVKRRLGVKDMGRILPGHGGILDRIDSTLYASLIVCFVFVLRIMTVG